MANEKTYSRAGKITVFCDATPFNLLDICRQKVGQECKKQSSVSGHRSVFVFRAEELAEQETSTNHSPVRTSKPNTEIYPYGALNTTFLMAFCFVTLSTVERHRMGVQIVCSLRNRCRENTRMEN
jgi:hypothetical protein